MYIEEQTETQKENQTPSPLLVMLRTLLTR